MASLNKILLAGAVPIGTPGLSHFDRILGQALGGREVEKTATPGDIVTFTTNLAKPLTSLKVLITATQSGAGDPSPTNIRPITGWTGCTVTRTGVNVWDEQWELGMINTNTGAKGPSTAAIRNKNDIPVLPNTNYYFHINATSNTIVYYYRSDLSFIQASGAKQNTVFKTPNNCAWLRFMSTETTNNNISVNYPATDTEYHAYTGTTLPITFPASAGTVYGGTLDVLTGELTVTWGEIASYNGETLPGAWISDRDVYDPESTPTTGAQVIYELAAPVTYQLTPQAVDTLLGENVVFADTGAVSELKYLVKE